MTLDQALRALQYDDLRDSQKKPLEAILAGKDALVVMPTGGGKSALYQIPGLVKGGLTLVISPLIALMADQIEHLKSKSIPVVALHSRQTTEEKRTGWTTITGRKYDGWSGFVYSSPEALTDERIEILRDSGGVQLLAIDEAHCISEWGHEFRPAYRRIFKIREALGNPQTLAVTATATRAVRRDITSQLGIEGPTFVGKFDRPNIELRAIEVAQKERAYKCADLLKTPEYVGSSLVYCRSRRDANMCAGILLDRGISAASYHAGLRPDIQQNAQEAWTKGRLRVMVATTAFGMGIDKPDVRSIIHLGCQLSIEDYYQQIGRAGRDGLPSIATLLWGDSDVSILQLLARSSTPRPVDVESVWRWIRGKGRVAVSLETLAQMYRQEADNIEDDEFELGASALSRIIGLLALDGLLVKIPASDQPVRITVSRDPPDVKTRGRPSLLWRALQQRASMMASQEMAIDRDTLAGESDVPRAYILSGLANLKEKGLIDYEIARTNTIEIVRKDREVSQQTMAYAKERWDLVQRRIDDSILYPHAGATDRELRGYILEYFGSVQ